MDLVTILTACALGFKAELFVPPGVRQSECVVRPRRHGCAPEWLSDDRQMGSIHRGGSPAVRPAGSVGACRDAGRKPRRRRRYISGGCHRFDADYAGHIRARYGLGANAYDPHDNIIAGTAYMSEMIELFGVPNFLAAYNAGPARLEDHLRRGSPLPRETQQYLAQIGELPVGAPPPGELPAPQSGPFIGAPSNAPSPRTQTPSNSVSAPRISSARTGEGQHRCSKRIVASELFVQRWSNSFATPSLSTKPSSDRDVGIGFALFVPLGRDPMRLSANTSSSHPE